jgi:hypothetical protein
LPVWAQCRPRLVTPMPSNSEVGALRVSLGLDSAQFAAGLKRSQNLMSGFSKNVALGAAGAVAGFLSITSVVNGTKAALEQFGKINDLSVGSGLDPEIFQSLAHQAELAGVSMETMGAALAAFAKSSGQAEAGTGRMASQLAKLNPELLASIKNATSQEQRFRLVADAMAKIEDPAQRAALATAAFGDAGTKIAGAFAGGSAEIDVMMIKAQNLGIIVSRDLIANADAMGDSFDTASRIVDTQLKQAFVNAAPALVYLAGVAADLTRSFNMALDSLKGIKDQQRATLEDEYKTLTTGFGGIVGMFGGHQGRIDEIKGELRSRALDELREKLTAVKPQAEAVSETLATVPPVLKSIKEGANASATSLKQITVEGTNATAAWVDDAKDMFSSFFSDFRSNMKSGADGWSAFADAGISALDRLADAAMATPADGEWFEWRIAA